MSDNSEIDRRNKEKNARLDLSQQAGQEANTTSRTTSGQLLLVAGAILTFSSSVLTSSYTSHLSYGWKKLLVCSWILFAISALLGVVSLFIDYYYFRKWHRYHFAVGSTISNSVSPEQAVDMNKNKKPKNESSLWPLIVQSILIVIAAALFIMIISHAVLTN